MSSRPVSQIALHYGADDLDGTVEEYQITFDDGRLGERRQHLSRADMRRLIAEAGRAPVERDGLYEAVSA
jgi:aminodeoxyfutalosine synthase